MDLSLPQSEPKILVVEDDVGVRGLLSMIISQQGYACDSASSLRAARHMMAQRSYDILFLDLKLPDGFGLRILEEDLILEKNTVVTVVSGDRDLDTVVRAIREGAYDFISKPFDGETFVERLSKVVEEWRSRKRFTYYQRHLEQLIKEMTVQLKANSEQLEHTRDMTIEALGAAADLRDPETEEHCRRVAEQSVILGSRLGMSSAQLQNLRRGAYLHDIGKIGIPENILSKPGALSPQEMDLVRLHPVLGFRLVSKIDFLWTASDVVLYHHERFDGRGYPHGLRGRQIPLAPRVFAVVDTMDAMLNDRSYRKAVPFPQVIEELKEQSGAQFDPDVVTMVLETPRTLWEADLPSAAGE